MFVEILDLIPGWLLFGIIFAVVVYALRVWIISLIEDESPNYGADIEELETEVWNLQERVEKLEKKLQK